MGKVTKVRYFTKEKKDNIPKTNVDLYDKYLRSNIIKNKDVKDTTYNVYRNNMEQFMVYLYEQWGDIGLYDEELMDEAIDIMEGYIAFCVDTLGNNKKTINNKLATVSSFYHWSVKRKFINKHPFDKVLERMKGAQEEHIITSHYLNQEEIDIITEGLLEDNYDLQDRLIWGIMIDSCNRVGAIAKLTLSSLNLEGLFFEGIREKRGYKVEVTFTEETAEIIKEWLEVRKNMDNLTVDALFVTKFNGEYRQMTKMTIQNRINKIGKILGLEDFRSHSIRKTAGNLIYDQTGDLSLAAEALNHKSVETTRQAYIKPRSKSEVMAKIAEIKKAKMLEKNKK